MKYLQHRQNPLPNLPETTIELAFSKVVEHFGLDWLSKEKGSHALQKLWTRRDALSTNELFTFGSSMIAAEAQSKQWLQHQIKLVKGKDENNQKGAIFEILVLGYASSNQKVIPAKASQSGYDIDIEANQSSKFRVSIKCYSESTHERRFKKSAEVARQKLIHGLRASGQHATAYIEASTYPTEGDWQVLYTYLTQAASQFDGSKQIQTLNDKWLVGLIPLLSEKDEKFAPNAISHTFICSAKYHKNEQKNFLSKLESAISNIEKHVDSDSGYFPVILMRLPPAASASTLASWSTEYLKENKESILGAIFFVQPYTSSTEDGSSSYIAHYSSIASSPAYETIVKEGLQLEFPVGIVTSSPPSWQLCNDIGKRLPIDEKYIYQRGEHFIDGGSTGGGISRKAPGIESFLIVNVNGELITLGGRWGNDLCLLGG